MKKFKKFIQLVATILITTGSFAQNDVETLYESAYVKTEYSGYQLINYSQQNSPELGNKEFKFLVDFTRGKGIYTSSSTSMYYATDPGEDWEQSVMDNTPVTNKHNDYYPNAPTRAALDAHWGVAAAYDYFLKVHGRNGYDNRGSKINVVLPDDNTGYEGSAVYIGTDNIKIIFSSPTTYNGKEGYLYATGLDVVAHEFGHAVIEYSAGLTMTGESGAINEGIADILAVCVDNYTRKNNDSYRQKKGDDGLWSIGEDADKNGGTGYRQIDNPDYAEQPDSYIGHYWNKRDTIHTNMSVMSYWFYLLCEGGSGTNDLGTPYDVNGVGIDRGEKIVYRALMNHMRKNTKFNEVTEHMYNAAKDLYGDDDDVMNAVINASNAVFLPLDCSGTYFTGNYMIGDGHCDDGTSGGYNFHCEIYNNDGGDCGITNTTISSCETVTGDTRENTALQPNGGWSRYGNPSPEHIYKFEAKAYGDFKFSTCGSNFDTYLRLYDENMNQIAYRDDYGCDNGDDYHNTVLEKSLHMGTYYILVEGYSNKSGWYTLSVNCDTPSDCVNDDTTKDSYGDTCTDWYDDHESLGSYGCTGAYDDNDFIASVQCTACRDECAVDYRLDLSSSTEEEKTIREAVLMDLSASLDPTTDLLTVKVEGKFDGTESLNYQLFDVLGNLLQSNKVTGALTNIDMENFPAAVYLLKVNNTSDKQEVKTFKIVKN